MLRRMNMVVIGVVTCLCAAVGIFYFSWYQGQDLSLNRLLKVGQYYSCTYYADLTGGSPLCPSNTIKIEGKSLKLEGEVEKRVLSSLTPNTDLKKVEIAYPIQGALFPPDIVPPLIAWQDQSSKSWIVHVALKEIGEELVFRTDGLFSLGEMDYRSPIYYEPMFDLEKFRAWRFDQKTWAFVKENSKKVEAVLTIYGLAEPFETAISDRNKNTARGQVSFKTAATPVDAPIFYRDLAVATVKDESGNNVLFSRGKFTGIKWRLRDISKEEGPVVMQNQPGCANCHALSRDGKWLSMEMDTETLLAAKDKSGYGIMPVQKEIVFSEKDIFPLSRFSDGPTGGFHPRPSPDGRYVIVSVSEGPHGLYFNIHPEKPNIFTFYLTRGILLVYDRETGEGKPLKGADDPDYVQHDADWSPDGKTVVFGRASVRDARYPKQKGKSIEDFAHDRDRWDQVAVDKEDLGIKYDLYTVPFNGGKGGEATPLLGASKNGKSNSFPRFSPDGKWLVYTQTGVGMLLQPDSELYIVPASGGVARRLNANTKFLNSWHSWAPNSRWLVFASKGFSNYTQALLTYIDENGNDSPPIIVPNTTARNRAVNLPEFFNLAPGAVKSIETFETAFIHDYDRAIEAINDEKWDKAEKYLLSSKEKNWKFGETFLAFGYVALKQGKKEEAKKHFEDVLLRDEQIYQARYNLGLLSLEGGDFDAAVGQFSAVLRQHPYEPNAWHNLGVAYAAKGNAIKAKEAFEKALASNPDRPLTYYNLGLLLKGQKEEDKAKDVLTKAMTIAKAMKAAELLETIRKAF